MERNIRPARPQALEHAKISQGSPFFSEKTPKPLFRCNPVQGNSFRLKNRENFPDYPRNSRILFFWRDGDALPLFDSATSALH